MFTIDIVFRYPDISYASLELGPSRDGVLTRMYLEPYVIVYLGPLTFEGFLGT